MSNGNEEPCGSAPRSEIHFMASSGSKNFFQWRVLKAHPSANCTLALSEGSPFAHDFKLLRPRDDSADRDGFFPCGRRAGFEGKEVKLPGDITCENCIIQLT